MTVNLTCARCGGLVWHGRVLRSTSVTEAFRAAMAHACAASTKQARRRT